MRALVFALVVCGASLACAADRWPFVAAVPLNTPQDLARLRQLNPAHYARAQRILAAANVLCLPGAPRLQNTDAHHISCQMILLTSNPPKRRLCFTLDSTRYIALVTITADPLRVTRAQ